MTLQRTFTCAKDVQLVLSGATNGGVGAGNVVSVGQTPGGARTRTEFAFEANWASVVSLVKVELVLKVTNNCAAPGSAVKFYVERLTSDFKEGNYANTCGVGSDNAEVWPGTGTVTTTHRAEYVGTPADGDIVRVNITALAADVLAAGDTKLRVRLAASDGAGGYDEANANRYVGFWSRERGNDGHGMKPRVEVQALDTHPPNVPTAVTPTTLDADTASPQAARVDRTFVVRAKFTDADPNDYMTASHVQVYPKGSTDDASGNILVGTELHTFTGTGVYSAYTAGALLVAQTVTAPADAVGREVLYRLRMRDTHGLWGPWTRLADGRIVPNTRPTAPTGLAVDTGSTTPDMTGRHNDVDRGSTVRAVETQVVHESAAGVEMLMNRTSHQDGDPDSGPYVTDDSSGGPQPVPPGGTLWRVSYDGTRPLRSGERVKRRHRTVDQFGAVGDFSAWTAGTWVVGESAVPTFIPDPATKRDDLTPLLGASYPATISGLWVEVYQDNDLASLRYWAPPERSASGTSKVIEYGSVSKGKPLTWGQQPWGRAKVRVASTGDPTGWTELQPILLNSLPLAPAVSADLAALGSDGVWRVPSLTPRILCKFRDPDLPNDTPSKRVLQLFRAPAGGAPLYTATVTTGIEDWADIPASAAMAWETDYVVKVRHADTSGELGPFGQFAFTTHRAPTLATGVGPVVGNPRSTVRWTATFYGSATQAGYQVVWYDVTHDVGLYDTGFVEDTTAVSAVVPAYVLPDDSVVQARVYVTDTKGVTSLLIGQSSVNSAINATSATSVAMVPVVSSAPGSNLPADTFLRGAVTDSWGTSSSGHTYVYMGTPADYDTNATQGTMVLAAGVARRAHFDNVRLGNVTAAADVKTDKLAVGSTLAAGVSCRCLDLTNFYRAELVFNTDATVDLVLVRVVDGVRMALASYRTAITHVAGTFYTVKVNAVTSYVAVSGGASYYSTALQAKAWATGGGEPAYQVTATDATAQLQDPSGVGVGARTAAGITNANVTFTWDNIATSSP